MSVICTHTDSIEATELVPEVIAGCADRVTIGGRWAAPARVRVAFVVTGS
jgi:hypothetical protein